MSALVWAIKYIHKILNSFRFLFGPVSEATPSDKTVSLSFPCYSQVDVYECQPLSLTISSIEVDRERWSCTESDCEFSLSRVFRSPMYYAFNNFNFHLVKRVSLLVWSSNRMYSRRHQSKPWTAGNSVLASIWCITRIFTYICAPRLHIYISVWICIDCCHKNSISSSCWAKLCKSTRSSWRKHLKPRLADEINMNWRKV